MAYTVSMRAHTIVFVLLIALLVRAGVAAEPWGTDTNAGDGPKLLDVAAPELLRIIKASEPERPALIKAYAAGKAADQIEAVKRFRNAELHELFTALAVHENWKVRHRALYVLEFYNRPGDLALAFAALDHEEPRLREKAAISAIKLWSAKHAGEIDGNPKAIVAKRLDVETNPHVGAALAALKLRMAGKLTYREVYREHAHRRPDGLMVSPFLSGMHLVKKVAPGYTKKGVSESGGSSASKLPAGPYTSPIILFGKEARSGLSLQPFANLRRNATTYHTGLDAGACLDGAGYYAIAPGVVRFVYSGSDMGTLIVVQHHLGDKRTVNAVYMHGGDTAFVKGGDKVASGQLIGTMGLGYSIENGGHYAHIHFGLYPGEFSTTHNYGYRSVKAGLSDWYDPMHFIPLWTDLTAPLWSGAGEASGEDLEKAVAAAPERAAKMRDMGYPAHALRFLATAAKEARGVPGAKELGKLAKAWKKDKAVKAALKAEKKFLATEDKTRGMGGRPKEAKALWEKFLAENQGTCLVPRIKQMIKGVGFR